MYGFLGVELIFLLTLLSFTSARGAVVVNWRYRKRRVCNSFPDDSQWGLFWSSYWRSTFSPNNLLRGNFLGACYRNEFFSLFQPRPHLMPSPRLTVTWLLTSGRRPSSPSLLTRSECSHSFHCKLFKLKVKLADQSFFCWFFFSPSGVHWPSRQDPHQSVSAERPGCPGGNLLNFCRAELLK